MQYDIENKVKYTNSSNSNATSFAHVPTLTVAMEEIGPIRDIEFAPLEDNDENKEDEKSIEDDIKRKRIASTNFIAVAANKVSKANVIDLRSRSVLPESFQIEKWYDDILCVAWLPKGAYMYGCDSTISFNGRNFRYLLRQCDGPICWEEDEKEGKYVGIVGFHYLPRMIFSNKLRTPQQRRHQSHETSWPYDLVNRFAHFRDPWFS